MPSRRAVLRNGLAGLSVGIGTAGCSTLGLGGPPDLSLVLLNFTEETRYVYVHLLRADQRNRGDAVELTEEYEVPPTLSNGETVDENVVETDRYLVRVKLSPTSGVSDHYHFFPEDCTGNGEPPEELYIECRRNDDDHPNDGYYFTFQQTRC